MSVAWYRSGKGAIRDSPPQGPTDGPEPHHTLSLAYLEKKLRAASFFCLVLTTLTRRSLSTPYAQHYKRPYKATLGLGGDSRLRCCSLSSSCEDVEYVEYVEYERSFLRDAQSFSLLSADFLCFSGRVGGVGFCILLLWDRRPLRKLRRLEWSFCAKRSSPSSDRRSGDVAPRLHFA
jgi:hypothetical protein